MEVIKDFLGVLTTNEYDKIALELKKDNTKRQLLNFVLLNLTLEKKLLFKLKEPFDAIVDANSAKMP